MQINGTPVVGWKLANVMHQLVDQNDESSAEATVRKASSSEEHAPNIQQKTLSFRNKFQLELLICRRPVRYFTLVFIL